MSARICPKAYSQFGEYVKARREELDKSIRGLATELEMTPAYLRNIEKGNRYASEKYLSKMVVLLQLSDKEDICENQYRNQPLFCRNLKQKSASYFADGFA